MSEIVGSASVLVIPDTAKFRAELEAGILAATKGVQVIVPVVAAAAANTAIQQQVERGLGIQSAVLTTTKARTDALSKAEDFLAKTQARLAGVGDVVALRTSELSKARAALTETSAAVRFAEKAVEQALLSNNAELIAATEETLALARAQEEQARAAALAAIEQGKAAAAARAAQRLQTQGARAQAAAAIEAAAAQGRLTKASVEASIASGVAATQLGAVGTGAALRTSTLSKARSTFAEANAAVVASEAALNAAIATGNKAFVEAAFNAALLTKGVQALARAQVEATIAGEALAATQAKVAEKQAFAARGAGTQALQFLGLRGATLAANASFIAGAAATILFAKAIGSAAGFEKQLNVFRVTARATADEMGRVADTAKQLGADITLPAVSAADAAQAMTELAKAGLSVRDSISGARGVLELATAAEIDNAAATEIVASAINAFGLAGADAVHVADLLANSSIEAQGSIADMGGALSQVASVSRQVGISIEDTVALLTLLAKNGIQGSAAGTVLRVALLRLVAPSTAAAKIINSLGISIRDAQGRIRPDVFAQFAEATANLGAKTRDADAAIVFGTRGIRAQAILGREGADGLNAMRDATERAGAAAEIAGARAQGLSGQVEALKSNLETLGITLGSITLGPLTAFLSKINDGVGFINDFANVVGKISKISIPDIKFDVNIGPVHEHADTSGTSFGHIFGVAAGTAANLAFDNAIQQVVPVAGPAKLGKDLVNLLSGPDVQKADTLLQKTTNDIQELFNAFSATGGPTALNQLVLRLNALADQLDKGSPKSQAFAANVRAMIRDIQDFGNLPPTVIDIQTRLDPAKAREEARGGGKIVIDTLKGLLSPEAGRAIGLGVIGGIGSGLAEGAPDAAKKGGEALKLGLSTQFDVLEATGGSNAAKLANLRQQQADAAARLARNQRRFAAGELPQAAVDKAAQEKTAIDNQIKAILDKQATDAKSAASAIEATGKKISEARKNASDAQVKIFSNAETRIQNLLVRASATESLGDDIRFNIQLRAILRNQIAAAGTKIKDLETRRDFVRTTTARILTLTNQIISDTKKNNQALRQAVRDKITNKFDILDAKLHIAEVNENTAAQRQIINAQIANLKDRISHEKGNTLLILQLKGQIAERQKALKDLGSSGGGRFERLELRLQIAQVKEQVGLQRKLLLAEVNLLKERIKHEKGVAKLQDILLLAQKQKELKALQGAKDSNAFNKATFEFLQTQQGFAANLFGNLIPGGATGGLVGGTTAGGTSDFGVTRGGSRSVITPPGIDPLTGRPFRESGGPATGIQNAAVLKGAREQQGFTNTQSATVIQLLQRMVEELASLRSGTGHPEAKRQKVQVAANSNPHGF